MSITKINFVGLSYIKLIYERSFLMKKLNKILSIGLAAMMAVSTMSISAFAEDSTIIEEPNSMILYDTKPLFVKVDNGLSNNSFSITAPSVPGKYEVCAIFVPNPFNNVPTNSFNLLQYSYRFTLTVE